MKRIYITPGNTYGLIHVLSVCESGKYKKYNCRCIKCNREFVTDGQTILENQAYGCLDCKRLVKEELMTNKLNLEYKNKRYNSLVIEEVLNKRYYSNHNVRFVRCRCDCGNIIELPLARLKSWQAKTCGHDKIKNLKKGHELSRAATVSGTLVYAIDGRRKSNSNNISGCTGVNWIPRIRKYRAYINFRRKYYHLGTYDNITDAIQARKYAEQELYGDFLDWYKNTYPDRWNKMQKRKTGTYYIGKKVEDTT